MIERVEYNCYASVYMHFDSNFGQVMNIKYVDSLVGWDQAHWRGKREKNGEWSGLSNDNDRESLNSIAPQTMHPLKIFNWPFSLQTINECKKCLGSTRLIRNIHVGRS